MALLEMGGDERSGLGEDRRRQLFAVDPTPGRDELALVGPAQRAGEPGDHAREARPCLAIVGGAEREVRGVAQAEAAAEHSIAQQRNDREARDYRAVEIEERTDLAAAGPRFDVVGETRSRRDQPSPSRVPTSRRSSALSTSVRAGFCICEVTWPPVTHTVSGRSQ